MKNLKLAILSCQFILIVSGTERAIRNALFQIVSNSIKSLVRTKDLSFNHHQLVAPLIPLEQKEWLQKAIDNKWTVGNRMKQVWDRLSKTYCLKYKLFDGTQKRGTHTLFFSGLPVPKEWSRSKK